jgi:sterol desaturase/sphingolipid hydroxylase (fatty acid hydroxylase superfamily)
MKQQWFVRRAWFAVPASLPGAGLTVLVVLFVIQVFVAVDRHSHSVSDTLYGVFPFVACAFLLLDWVAQRTGAAR